MDQVQRLTEVQCLIDIKDICSVPPILP